jgi:hypothetical protein
MSRRCRVINDCPGAWDRPGTVGTLRPGRALSIWVLRRRRGGGGAIQGRAGDQVQAEVGEGAIEGGGDLAEGAELGFARALDRGHGLTAEPGQRCQGRLIEPGIDSPVPHALAQARRCGLAVALGLGSGAGSAGLDNKRGRRATQRRGDSP